jgi:hypothetical protein
MPQVAGGRFANADEADLIIPRVQLFHGTAEEKEKYGKHEDGDFINTMTMETIGVSGMKFVPLIGWKEWIKFKEPRGTGLDYRTRNKSEVPPADLAWTSEGPNRKGPAATEFINWAVLIVDADGNLSEVPVVFSFKRTSFKTGQTLISQENFYRGNKGPGFYAMDVAKKSTAKGPTLIPKLRPLGDPPAEMKDAIAAALARMQGVNVETNIDGDVTEPDDDIPI